MRVFDVAFGADAADQTVLLTAVPVWEARQFAMKALADEADRVAERDADASARLHAVRERIQFAELGSIVFGHVEHYTGLKNQRMFIALLPTGTDYRDAGYKPAAAFGRLTGRPLFNPNPAA